jgi:hypothetical protein
MRGLWSGQRGQVDADPPGRRCDPQGVGTGAGRPMLTGEPQASRRWALVNGRRNLLTRLS